MKAIVLGAGVIGVTSAYFLAKEGFEVEVLDSNLEAAMSCSKANGGQLSYSHIETWAESFSLLNAGKLLLNPSSFLSFSDFFNKNFYSWFFKFYQNSFANQANKNSQNLYKISSLSKIELENLVNSNPNLNFNYKNEGILHFYRSEKLFNKAVLELKKHQEFGVVAEILNAQECIKKEPTLIKLFDEGKLAGGIFYPLDASGNCRDFTVNLAKICKEKYGVKFHFGVEIKNILTNHQKITGINTSKQVFVGDKYVYALAVGGVNLLKGIKIDAKIYPLKGYSLSMHCDKEFVAPNLSLTDSENKIVYSRLGNIFRAAGSVEICGFSKNKNNRHINFLKRIIANSFSDFGNMNRVVDWQGFRPFRPNSIPLICRVEKYQNLYLNSGHGSLGFTLSCGSAKILSEIILEKNNDNFSFLKEEEKTIYIK
jgi:D-amino-acid dehydrogenase